jgi:hypothetical protein
MKSTLATLALFTLALFGGAAQAQTRAALVQDIQRPTAANIVNVHCNLANVTACPLYTVPTGKILHVTQLAYVVNGNVGYFQIGTDNFTSLWFAVPNKTDFNFATTEVNLYLPAGSQVIARTPTAAAYMDVTVYGTLSDQ